MIWYIINITNIYIHIIHLFYLYFIKIKSFFIYFNLKTANNLNWEQNIFFTHDENKINTNWYYHSKQWITSKRIYCVYTFSQYMYMYYIYIIIFVNKQTHDIQNNVYYNNVYYVLLICEKMMSKQSTYLSCMYINIIRIRLKWLKTYL